MLCHACHTASGRAVPRLALPNHAKPCLALPRPASPATPDRVGPDPATPRLACRIAPSPALPRLACRTALRPSTPHLPRPASPRRTSPSQATPARPRQTRPGHTWPRLPDRVRPNRATPAVKPPPGCVPGGVTTDRQSSMSTRKVPQPMPAEFLLKGRPSPTPQEIPACMRRLATSVALNWSALNFTRRLTCHPSG